MKNLRRIVVLFSLLFPGIVSAEEPLTIEMVEEWTRLPPTMIEGTVAITDESMMELEFRAYYDAESEAILLSNERGAVLVHYHPSFGGSHIWIKGRPDFFDSERDNLRDNLSLFRPLAHFHYLGRHIENADGRSATTAAGTPTSGTVTVNTGPYGFHRGVYAIKHTVANSAITSLRVTPPNPGAMRINREFSNFDSEFPWLPRSIQIAQVIWNGSAVLSIDINIHNVRAVDSAEAALKELTVGLTKRFPPETRAPAGATTPAFRTAVTWITRGIAAALVLIAALLYWHRRRHPV